MSTGRGAPGTCADWQVRFEQALARRQALGFEAEGTTAYRLAHGEADGAPGWAVDVYDRWLLAHRYTDDATEEAQVLDALSALPFAGVYLKRRPKQANVVDDREREQRTPSGAVRGDSAPEPLVIQEAGVRFETSLGDGFSTGLFLDQRPHRTRLRAAARGRVLNLFAYTCGFGVAAALGGAETVNVDLAKRALEWGKRNYALNGLSLDRHRFFARDAFDFLARAQQRGERFDTVVLDPPSYARGRRGRFNASRDYVDLCAAALGVVGQGGELLACTNQQALPPKRFEIQVSQAAERAGVELASEVRAEPLDPDFPVEKGGVPHLKAAWLKVRSGG